MGYALASGVLSLLSFQREEAGPMPQFQIDINEDEDVVILRQVQMFFWPWEDDEEFEEVDYPNDET